MGSDIGGSVRIPATFCGVVGHRPTPGLVPFDRRAVAMTPLDLQGPLARNVKDAAFLLSAMAMPGVGDPMAFPHDASKLRELGPVDLGSLRIGISSDLGCAPVAKSIRSVFGDRMTALSRHVAGIEEVPLGMNTALDVFWILRGVYFAAAHKRHYEEHCDKLGATVRSNYEAAMEMTMEQVGWACREQMSICQKFEQLYEDFDVLICPGVGVPPFPHKQNFPKEIDGVPMENYVQWVGLTSALSVTGHPVTAIPCGYEPSGTPFGIQVVGPRYGDRQTLSVAAALEELFAGDPVTARPVPNLEKLL
jgi:amidase